MSAPCSNGYAQIAKARPAVFPQRFCIIPAAEQRRKAKAKVK
jgi:hypothetical protein